MDKRRLSRRDFLRLSALAAAGVTAAACAPGCAPATPKVEGNATPAPGEQQELIVHWRTDATEMGILEPMWREFEQEFPEYKIKAVYTSEDEHDKKTEMMIAAGTPPAMWFCAGYKSQAAYAEEDQLMVLNSYIDRDKYDMSDFYEDSKTVAQWGEDWIGLPISVVPVVLIYNKTLFDEAGVPYPTTDWNDKGWSWETLLEKAKALTKEEGGKTTQFGLGGIHAQRYAVRNFGTNYWTNEESRYPDKLEITPVLLDAFQFMADLQNKWKVMPTPGQTEALAAGAPSPFMSGKIAMEMNGIWVLSQYAEIEAFEWDVAALPYPIFMGHDLERTDWYYLDALSAFNGTQHPDGAWELLKFHCRPENMVKYPLGVGFIPARQSLAKDYANLLKAQFGMSAESAQPIVDAAGIESPNQAAFLPHWTEVYEKGIKPSLDNIMLGEVSAEDGAKAMEPVVNQILQEARKAHGLT